jgi:hypothetical protein
VVHRRGLAIGEPDPGDIRLLKRLAGRILSQQLDRGKPLWEMWVVEGVEDDRFAVIVKAHHCMVDGISGLDLLAGVLRADPDSTLEPTGSWYPRPSPSQRRLLRDELLHRASWPLSAIRSAGRALWNPREVLGDLEDIASGLGELLTTALKPTASRSTSRSSGPRSP